MTVETDHVQPVATERGSWTGQAQSKNQHSNWEGAEPLRAKRFRPAGQRWIGEVACKYLSAPADMHPGSKIHQHTHPCIIYHSL